MIKTRKTKVISIENEEIIKTVITTKRVITKIINNNDGNENKNWQSHKNIKKLKENKNCLSKRNSYLLKKEKRSESHLLL